MDASPTPSAAGPVAAAPVVDGDGVATLVVAGEKSLNIVGTPAIAAAIGALEGLRDDPRLRVLVLRGGERSFVGGADIREMATLTPPTARDFIARLRDLCEALRRF